MARAAKKPKDELSDEAKTARYWLGELSRARKVVKQWDDRSDKIIQRYRDERNRTRMNQRRFNVLWSNVQTTKPAIFAKQPRPIIERRFLEDNDVERIAGTMLERCVIVEIEQSGFMPAVDKAVLDYLLPGRGITWWRYEAEFDEQVDDQDIANDEALENDEGEQETSLPKVTEEALYCDYIDRKDYLCDPARTEEEVRWKARRLWLSKKQVTAKLGAEVAGKVSYQDMKLNDNDPNSDQNEVKPAVKRAEFWQIWDKTDKQVLVVSPSYNDGICDQYPDPLRLRDFFPTPKPLYATMTNDSLVPVPDYAEYQDQAEELDVLTQRIGKITEAIKVTGVYDASQPDLKRLIREGTDNIMVPCETWAVLKDKGGLKGSVEFFPLEMLVETLKVLYEAREKSKEVLYEVTGVADLMRGAGASSETATAARIKGQFGTLRLQDRQKAVANFCRDNIRIMAELISEHFSPVTMAAMSAMADKSQIEMVSSQVLDPQKPPDQDTQDFMAAVKLLKDDRLRSFRLDVETDSTINVDAQETQNARTMFLTAASQFIAGVLPVAEKMPSLTPLFGQMLLFGARGFQTSRELESTLEQTVRKFDQDAAAQMNAPPQNPQAMAEQGKLELEDKRIQADERNNKAKMALELAKHRDTIKADLAKHKDMMSAERAKLALSAQQHRDGLKKDEQDRADKHMPEQQAVVQATDSHLKQMVDNIAQQTEYLKSMMDQLAEAHANHQAVVQHLQSPSQVVHDQHGNAVGVRKGNITKPIMRNPEGRPIGLG